MLSGESEAAEIEFIFASDCYADSSPLYDRTCSVCPFSLRSKADYDTANGRDEVGK